ncbi:MAG: RNA polymerase sigma factor [Candidatus Limnocylindrales bacterium]
MPKLRDPDRYDAWQHRLLIHACYDLLRGRRRRNIHATVRAIPDQCARQDDGFIERERLTNAFGRLSPDHRAVVVLHFYRDMSAGDIATVLGVPIGTVSSRLHYGTQALRAALAADDRANGLTGVSERERAG